MDNLYFKNEGQITVSINAGEISSGINDILKKRIKNEIEGKCIKEGYIRPGSINIIGKSVGRILMNHFNGSIIYHVKYTADICNPVEGMIISAKVMNINKMGVLAYGGEEEPYPLNILLAKQHHIDNEFFDKLQEHSRIYVKIVGIRKEYGDSQISVIGKLVNDDEVKLEAKPEVSSKSILQDNITYYAKSKNYKWLAPHNKAEPFEYKGRIYATVEHAFHSQKNMDPDFQDLFTMDKETYIGDDAHIVKKQANKTNMKKLGKKLVADWDNYQIEIMKDITKIYLVANPDIKEKLISTDTKELIYSGPGADSFWGKVKDSGENNHGKIIMELRSEF